MISLTVNGDTRRTAASTIAELVRELDLDPAKVAVERNGTIAPRSELAAIFAENENFLGYPPKRCCCSVVDRLGPMVGKANFRIVGAKPQGIIQSPRRDVEW